MDVLGFFDFFPDGCMETRIQIHATEDEELPPVAAGEDEVGEMQYRFWQKDLDASVTTFIRINFRGETYVIQGTPAFLLDRIEDLQQEYNRTLAGEHPLVVTMKQERLTSMAYALEEESQHLYEESIQAHPIFEEANQLGTFGEGRSLVYGRIACDGQLVSLWNEWETGYHNRPETVVEEDRKLRDRSFHNVCRSAGDLSTEKKSNFRRRWNAVYKEYSKNDFMLKCCRQHLNLIKVFCGNNDMAYRFVPANAERIYILLFALQRNDRKAVVTLFASVIREYEA